MRHLILRATVTKDARSRAERRVILSEVRSHIADADRKLLKHSPEYARVGQSARAIGECLGGANVDLGEKGRWEVKVTRHAPKAVLPANVRRLARDDCHVGRPKTHQPRNNKMSAPVQRATTGQVVRDLIVSIADGGGGARCREAGEQKRPRPWRQQPLPQADGGEAGSGPT